MALNRRDVPEVRLREVGVSKGLEKGGEGPEGTKVVSISVAQPEQVLEVRYQRVESFLLARSFPEKTARSYRQRLRAFCDWVGKDWEHVSLQDLTRYQAHLEGRSLKVATRAAALVAIKSLYSWLKKSGQIEDNPADGVTVPVIPEGRSKELQPDEVERLFAAVEDRKTAVRDRAMLLLWFNAGLRASEVVNLDVGDYNNVEVMVREAKHGSDGPVPTDEETHEALVAYLMLRAEEQGGELREEDPMFVSVSNRSKGKRITYDGVYKVLKEIAATAGLENVTPHRGRHTFSSGLIEDEVDSYLAMTLMRQRSLKAFQTYNNRVRQRAARAEFQQKKGVEERPQRSVTEILKAEASIGEVEEIVTSPEIAFADLENEFAFQVPLADAPDEQVVQVRFKLWVEGRKKAKVRKEIERQVFSYVQGQKTKPRGNEYLLTLTYYEEEGIPQVIGDMLWQMEAIAELDDCRVSWEYEVIGPGPELASMEEPLDCPKVKAGEESLDAALGTRVYQLKIKLLGVRPQVWRRIQVSETMTLAQLHSVLQVAMGWEGYHLHKFSILEDEEDETQTLAELCGDELFSFSYLYDFGDMWEHEIKVEKRLAGKSIQNYPVCLAGKQACPPEDCGGDWGYAHLLRVLKNPQHPEYRERKEWLGSGFDPKAFDLKEVNQACRDLEFDARDSS